MRLPHLLPLLLAAPLRAQLTLYELEGQASGDLFGMALAAADVDGDGTPDIVVGAPGADGFRGRVLVRSGLDGALLLDLAGPTPSGGFGFAVAGAGDLDGDGRDELLVGAPFASPGGEAFVLSGADGAVLHHWASAHSADFLGIAVASAGDTDGDGWPDLLIAAHQSDLAGLNAGRVELRSGRDGALRFAFLGDAPEDELGKSVAGAGDVDGDGYADVILGAWFADPNGIQSGLARVHSGRDGALLWRFEGDAPFDNLGRAVAGAGDLDGDGHADLVVGIPHDDDQGTNAGSARVFSGASGAILFEVHGEAEWELLGQSVAGVGDWDGDGTPDLCVGANWSDAAHPDGGAAWIVSGADGALLARFAGATPGAELGFAVAAAGDLNGDGRGDVLLGAWRGGSAGTGLARVVLAGCPEPRRYCTAKVGSSGCAPEIDWSGAPVLSVGADDFHVEARGVLAGQPGLLFLGARREERPFAGGTLCIGGARRRTPVQQSGGAGGCTGSFDLHLPRAFLLGAGFAPGASVFTQYWYRDPFLAPPEDVGLSDALAFRFCP